MRVLVLVDGEHYPPVTRWGVQGARSMGYQVLAALFLGGTEKLPDGEPPDLGVPLLDGTADPLDGLARAIEEVRPEAVLDLSDEPVAGYRERMALAAVALSRGIPYIGPDFRLDPPIWEDPLSVPTVAVIGTGKRTGKTAVAGEVARVAVREGRKPVVVAMGRGGPAAPQVAEAGSVTMERLLGLARRGEHAASDYLEDALTTGVTTVGARRCGGGLAGAPFVTNAGEAARAAAGLGAGTVILEGSGSAVPPVPWDAGVLCVPASLPEEYLGGYQGPLRILMADLIVVTMATGPDGPEKLSTLRSHVERFGPDARFVVTDFEPVPMGDVQAKSVFFTTTAPGEIAERQAQALASTHGCRVVGWSANLADRAALGADLDAAPDFEVLLTELKAAAVDVGAERALSRGAEVVFVDNRPRAAPGEPDLTGLIEETLGVAERVCAERA